MPMPDTAEHDRRRDEHQQAHHQASPQEPATAPIVVVPVLRRVQGPAGGIAGVHPGGADDDRKCHEGK